VRNVVATGDGGNAWRFIAIAIAVIIGCLLVTALMLCILRPEVYEPKKGINVARLPTPATNGPAKDVNSTDEENRREYQGQNMTGMESADHSPRNEHTAQDLPIGKIRTFREYENKNKLQSKSQAFYSGFELGFTAAGHYDKNNAGNYNSKS
jgi:hypothetical protein